MRADLVGRSQLVTDADTDGLVVEAVVGLRYEHGSVVSEYRSVLIATTAEALEDRLEADLAGYRQPGLGPLHGERDHGHLLLRGAPDLVQVS